MSSNNQDITMEPSTSTGHLIPASISLEPGSIAKDLDPTSSMGSLAHPIWSRHLPVQFRDVFSEPSLPSKSLPYSEPLSEPFISTSKICTLPCGILHIFDSFWTSLNKISIACNYHHQPVYDLDALLMLDQLSNIAYEPPHDSSRTNSLDVHPLSPAPS